MLTIRAFINENLISEIRIVNTLEQDKDGNCKYWVMSPASSRVVYIWHNRNDNWTVLAGRALAELGVR